MGEAIDRLKEIALANAALEAHVLERTRVEAHTRTNSRGQRVHVDAYYRSTADMSFDDLLAERDALKTPTTLMEQHRKQQVINEIRHRTRFPTMPPARSATDLLARRVRRVERTEPPKFFDYTDGDLRKSLVDKIEELGWHVEDDPDGSRRQSELQTILAEDARRARPGRESVIWGVDPEILPSPLPHGYFTRSYDEIYSRMDTMEERDLIEAWESYQDEGHSWMNAVLRKGTLGTLSDTGVRTLQDMETAWQTYAQPLEEDAVVWRYMPEVAGATGGVSWSPGTFFKEGTTIRDKGYTSVSAKRDDSMQWTFGAWTMMIRVPKGTRVMPGHVSERELILGRNGIFEIIRVDGEKQQIEVVFRGYAE